jgi:hypothetical protein
MHRPDSLWIPLGSDNGCYVNYRVGIVPGDGGAGYPAANRCRPFRVVACLRFGESFRRLGTESFSLPAERDFTAAEGGSVETRSEASDVWSLKFDAHRTSVGPVTITPPRTLFADPERSRETCFGAPRCSQAHHLSSGRRPLRDGSLGLRVALISKSRMSGASGCGGAAGTDAQAVRTHPSPTRRPG